jgi:hypothetical protein
MQKKNNSAPHWSMVTKYVCKRVPQNMLEHEVISLISEANENLPFGLNLVKT